MLVKAGSKADSIKGNSMVCTISIPSRSSEAARRASFKSGPKRRFLTGSQFMLPDIIDPPEDSVDCDVGVAPLIVGSVVGVGGRLLIVAILFVILLQLRLGCCCWGARARKSVGWRAKNERQPDNWRAGRPSIFDEKTPNPQKTAILPQISSPKSNYQNRLDTSWDYMSAMTITFEDDTATTVTKSSISSAQTVKTGNLKVSLR